MNAIPWPLPRDIDPPAPQSESEFYASEQRAPDEDDDTYDYG